MIDRHYRKTYESLFKEAMHKVSRGFFDEAALPSYTHSNWLMSWLFWKRIDAALKMAGDVQGKAVLDFGCGGGVTFNYLSSHGARVYGCENQFYQLAEFISERLKAGVTIYRTLSDIGNVQFDIIMALDVFEHVEDLGNIIDVMLELSHNETTLIVSGPTENILYRAGRQLAGFSGHYHRRNIYDIEGDLIKRGFRRVGIKRLFSPLTFFRVSSWRILNEQA